MSLRQKPDFESAESKNNTPAKKNRTSTQLDATEEEEDSNSGLDCSPPTESKIRQISQGVEDITWKHIQKGDSPDRDLEMQPRELESTTEHHDAATSHCPSEEVDVHAHGIEVESIKPQETGGDEAYIPPLLLQSEIPPHIVDGDSEDEHAGQADPVQVPLGTQAPDAVACNNLEVLPEAPATPTTPPVSTKTPSSRRVSESEAEMEKGVKRKLRDRTVSERLIPGEVVENDDAAAHKVAATKRQRDDADADANPRVTKRPTPPPDEKAADGRKTGQKAKRLSSQGDEASTAPAASSTPKLVCAISFINP